MSHVAKLTIQPAKTDYRLVANQVREALDGLVIGKHASGAEITFRDMRIGHGLGARDGLTEVLTESCKQRCDLARKQYALVKLAHPALETGEMADSVKEHVMSAAQQYMGDQVNPALARAFQAMDATVDKMLEGYGIRPARQIGG